MAVIYKAKDFISKVKNIAQNYNTIYCWGSFGFPITQSNITRLVNQYPSVYTTSMQTKLKSLVGKNYFGFDCVGLIKGVLWGFTGDKNKSNGGTAYCSNGVNDIDCNAMFNLCSGKSTDFSNIVPGEFLWMQGHIGVYIGDGLAVEATASWENKVQITAVANIGTKSGYNLRRWTKHGNSPFIDYSDTTVASTNSTISTTKITTITNCKNIYLSKGVAAIRPTTSLSSSISSRCVKGNYYVASQTVKPSGNSQTWFKNANTGMYSAIDDTDGSKLFTFHGIYKEGKANAICNIRAKGSLNGTIVGKINKGMTVYLTGKSAVTDGITWIEIVYNQKLCWCDKKWITY